MSQTLIVESPEAVAFEKSRARVRYNQAMKQVRRAHLYAGLFMTPWVFLYGGTALLFNHPGLFSDQEIRSIQEADLAGTPLADFPGPQELAVRVVEALNRQSSEADDAEDAGAGVETGGDAYRLVREEEAAYNREFQTTVSGGGRDHLVRLDLSTRSGTIRSGASRESVERNSSSPFTGLGRIRLEPAPLDSVSRALPVVLTRLGLPADPAPRGRDRDRSAEPKKGRDQGRLQGAGEPGRGERRSLGEGRQEVGARGGSDSALPESGAGMRTAGAAGGPGAGATGRFAGPELAFYVEGRGKVWRASYNLQTGAITGRPAEATAPSTSTLTTRRFLTRLHTAHGYPAGFEARWVWAVAVDLMFVSMVGWGLTGLLMWWQMKNLRRIGSIVLTASALVSTAVAIGMHSAMVGGP
jgi:hypothetical protein